MPPSFPENVSMKRAHAVAERIRLLLLVSADMILSRHPNCKLTLGNLLRLGSDEAMAALFDLSPVVVDVMTNHVLETITFMVGESAITHAVMVNLHGSGRPERQDRFQTKRMSAIANYVRGRLVVSAHLLLSSYPGCGLSVARVSYAGGDAARLALSNLPLAVTDVVSDRILVWIAYMVGWTEMFDAIDDDLWKRFPPGRLGSDS
jgi:hypothetical protein